MRIIRGKDYYDGGMAYGQDSDVVFVRDGETLSGKHFDERFDHHPIRTNYCDLRLLSNFKSNRLFTRNDCVVNATTTLFYRENYIIFCGKQYNYLEMFYNTLSATGSSRTRIWSMTALNDYLQAVGVDYTTNRSRHTLKMIATTIALEDYFETVDRQNLVDFCMNNQISIITRYNINSSTTREEAVFKINADDLKSFDFQRKLDCYTAFQELSMWVGNLPRQGNPIVEIVDDQIKAAKHGFDRWNFRRTSSEKPNS